MLLIIEGMAMCLILLLTCVVGIAKDGPVGLVTFYEKEVQDRVISLGLTTREKIRKSTIVSGIVALLPMLIFIPAMVLWPERCPGVQGRLPANARHRPDLRPV